MIWILFVAAAAKDNSLVRRVDVTAETKNKRIVVHVAPNNVTSVRFNKTFDEKSIVCGDNQSFLVQPSGDSQLTIKSATDNPHATTNCLMQTRTGVPLGLQLENVDKARADAFVDVMFQLNDLPSTEAELEKRIQQVTQSVDDRVKAAVRQCTDRAETALVMQAAEAIVSRRMNERAVFSDIVIVVREFVKIGSRGILRFSVENRSRDTWAAGAVKLSWSSGRDPVELEVTTAIKQPTLDRGEETFGAVSFDMYQLRDDARFTVQVLERNGTRHPTISAIRL